MGNKKSKDLIKQEVSKLINVSTNDLERYSELTRMSIDKIGELRAGFMKKNPKGLLNESEFIQFYGELRPEPLDNVLIIAQHVFRAFDADKNGFIDFKEFLVTYALTSNGDAKTKLEILFKIYDKDCNERLDRVELKEVLHAMLRLLSTSNSIDLDTLVNEVIQELDTSKDGYISKDEFMSGLLRNFNLRAIMNPFA